MVDSHAVAAKIHLSMSVDCQIYSRKYSCIYSLLNVLYVMWLLGLSESIHVGPDDDDDDDDDDYDDDGGDCNDNNNCSTITDINDNL